jgi:hypothetical protein
MNGSMGLLSGSFIFRRRKMPVERYLAELTLTFDVSDDLIIHRKFEYETYAANPEDAEATARLWAYDFRKKLAENTANYVSSQFYEHKPTPNPVPAELLLPLLPCVVPSHYSSSVQN